MNRYCWRLHPSSAGRWPCSTPEQLVGKHTSVCNTKFCFHMNDDVYIRPKSVKELGISGRIIDISFNSTAKSENRSEITTGSPSRRGKKRRLVEDARVSVQQYSFDSTDRIESLGATKTGIRPSRLFPVYDVCKDENSIKQTLLIITSDTTNYRQLATSHLRSSDKILEIGCSTGECTALLMRRLYQHQQRQKQIKEGNGKVDDASSILFHGKIVAFDVGTDILEQAQTRLLAEIDGLIPNDGGSTKSKMYSQLVKLQRIDAVADPKRAYAIATAGGNPDIILIDIGGNRELKGVVRMIGWVQTAFVNNPPRLVIIKSESLVDEVRNKQEGEKSSQVESERKLYDGSIRLNVTEHGVIENAQEWFSSLALSFAESRNDVKGSCSEDQPGIPIQTVPTYSHPVQAPLALSPKDNVTPICRYHNYSPDGCKRFNDSRACPYDHEHCHWCKQIGHVALHCKR